MNNAIEREFIPAEMQRIESITRQLTGLLKPRKAHSKFNFSVISVQLVCSSSHHCVIGADYFVPSLQLRFFYPWRISGWYGDCALSELFLECLIYNEKDLKLSQSWKCRWTNNFVLPMKISPAQCRSNKLIICTG